MNTKRHMHIFGEVLFDHFPDGSRVLGGAPFNVAWHLQAFGLPPRFISRIGDDESGREIVALMDGWGMSRDALQTDSEHPTGCVRVLLSDGEPHYDIVDNSAYDFINAESLGQQDSQGILYHGSLALRNPVSRAALQAVKAHHRGKIFVDVNLRPPWWERKMLVSLLRDADWVKLNEAELIELSQEQSDLESMMQRFCERFELETLVVTRGEKGAIAYGRQRHFVAVEPRVSTEVVDTVGAGDAFAALLLVGLDRQWPLEVTLERAQAFASGLVGRRGATVADRAFYRAFSELWT
ncbi:carbohydrate kinase [Methylomonas sp. LL1]|uniref:carbohydrate kinase family protein n=1 Tax=Methylomonas sp. LL1 TaxID=2785785 RepID=UPI0018C3F4A2|nr:carbohydrate kinase [Methylomonas sp. LL1]QPK63401.1 carbohydrate kinase [Methylomonas sp. LL1]